MEITMYDNLLQLPLFQGMRKDDFTAIIERVKFHFMTFKPNDTIVGQGAACNQLFFLLNGSIISRTEDKEYHYALSEVIKSPYIIEPYSLFGLNTNYKANYQAHEEAKLLSIDKSFIYDELNCHEIFRLNYLNILSSRYQTAHQKLWNGHIGTLEKKFAAFLLNRCQKADGEKYLQITMEDLGGLINETRINVSRMLKDLQEKGLLQLKRKEIYIPALDKLAEHLA